MKRAIERHDAGEARVIPIILRSCLWNLPDIPFSKLQVLPDGALPITKWSDPEEAFTNVAQHISNLVERIRKRKLEQKAEQQQTEELEKLRQVEQLAQQAAEAGRIRQEELEKQRQEQLHEAEKQQQPEQFLNDSKGNYAHLESLLQAGKWQEADWETADQMCKVMGRQNEGYLRVEDIEQFPCVDLRTIDRLWVKYSKGKFGFSVQKQIWKECGSPTKYDDWEKFGDRIGWRKGLFEKKWIYYGDLTFNTFAPKGHLPSPIRDGKLGKLKNRLLLARTAVCKL